MGKRQDITEYVLGEAIGITLNLRERNLDAMDLSGTPSIDFIISELSSRRKLVALSYNDGVQVTDLPTAEALVTIEPERQRLLRADTDYWYDLWADTGSGPIHQACGLFRLRSAVKP